MKLNYTNGVFEADNLIETDQWTFAWVGKFHEDPSTIANQFNLTNDGSFLNEVNGEFACIFKSNNVLLAATDKLAQYPIHYNSSSDISINQPAIAKKINQERFSDYVTNWSKLHDRSNEVNLLLEHKFDDVDIFDDVKQVQRGSLVKIHENGNTQLHYHRPTLSQRDVFDTFEEVVLDCVKGSKRPALAVGGGWDAYSILAILHKNNIYPKLVHVAREHKTDTECVRQIDKLLGTETIIYDEFGFNYDELPVHSFKAPTTQVGTIQQIQIGKLAKKVNADLLLHASDAEMVTFCTSIEGNGVADYEFLNKQHNSITEMFNNNIIEYQLWKSLKFANDMDIGALGGCVSLDPFIDWRMIEAVISSDYKSLRINKNIQKTVVRRFLPKAYEYLSNIKKDTRNLYTTDFLKEIRKNNKLNFNQYIKICNQNLNDFNIRDLWINEICLWQLRLLEHKNVN
jgi:hypothetical protein